MANLESSKTDAFGLTGGDDREASGGSKVLELANGMRVQGLTYKGGLSTFKGIPYAMPPVGERRWKPPSELENISSTEVVDCADFGSACLQSNGGDEDCLFLNVFIQNLDSSKKKPVAIFVHGGSYTTGASNQYDGGYNADYWRGEAILVTINYRLNVFGFLGSEELRSGDVDGSTGNYGIQDQRMAMKWVRDNIAAFGGDPEQVMIFGESAGAGSMSIHLTNQKSWPYYNKIALESGTMSPWTMQPMKLAQTKYNMVMEATGCGSAECLRSMPAAQLFMYASNVTSDNPDTTYIFWSPVCDDVEATTHPWLSIKDAASVRDVPMMHGTNTDEGGMFTWLNKQNATNAQLRLMWGGAGYLDVNEMEALYVTDKQYPTASTGYSPYWYAGERSVGDFNFGCPDLYAANTISGHVNSGKLQQARSYIYHFEHIAQYSIVEKPYVDHASELAFTFHLLYLMRNNDTTDIQCADLMSTYWGNFIVSGDPQAQHSFGVQLNDENIPEWTPYSSEKINVHAVQQGTSAGVSNLDSTFKRQECDYLIPVLEKKISEDFAK